MIVRAAWRNGKWLDENGEAFDFRAARNGRIDCPVQLCRKNAAPVPLRLAAVQLPPDKHEAARRRARRAARKKGYTLSADALEAAEWVLIVTSPPEGEFSADDILALYRMRRRVDIDQAWRLSRISGVGRLVVLGPRRQAAPGRRGGADRLQRGDCLWIGAHQHSAFRAAADIAAG